MRVAVVTFPGSNCDFDAHAAVVEGVGARAHYVWHRDVSLGDADLVILPGGFSYGDYLRAGAIARFSPVTSAVAEHARRGGPVLAICNGFQIACEAGLLPGALARNAELRFISDRVWLRVENASSMFTSRYSEGQQLRIPVAHGEGRYVADAETLARLEGDGRVAFRYVSASGQRDPSANVNGSAHDIAGILNADGNVLGMMPHPERAVDRLLGSTDGLALFESLLARVGA